MDKSNNMFTSIVEMLMNISTEIEIRNKKGLFDINREAEHFFCGLLNLVLDSNLVIANRLSTNYTSVDLVDTDARLAVQVTSTGTVEKVRHVLETFTKDELDSRFNELIVLVTSIVPNLERLTNVVDTTSISFSVRIWDIGTITSQIKTLSLDKMLSIKNYLQENCIVRPAKPAYPLPSLPPASDHFIVGSRDNELLQLGKMLKNREPIFISGLGGIGKTQTVIQFAKRHAPPKGAYFVRCITPTGPNHEIIRETILHANFLGYRFRQSDNDNRDQEYQDRINILRNEYAGAMLILDNLDFPGKSISDIQREQAYRDLTSLDVQLVFTTRSVTMQHNSITIGPLSDRLLLELMRTVSPSVDCDDNKLLSLIHAVDGHTLTVDLMARTMEDSWGDVTPDILLECLNTASVKPDIFPDISSDQNGWYRMGRLDQHLQVLFDLKSFSDEEYSILRCATLLPSGGMDIKMFCSSFKKKTCQKLLRSGWLSVENGLVRIHPVIRIVCIEELRPCKEHCNDFLVGIRKQYDRKYYDADKYRQMAELFENASKTLADENGLWAGEAGYFWKEVGEPERALALELRTVSLREQHHPDSQSLARAYNNVGITYSDLGNHEKALEYQLKALAIRERILRLDDPDLAISYNNVGSTYGDLGDYERNLAYGLKALAIFEQVLPVNHPDLATSYNNIGRTYGDLDDYEKALEYQLKALIIREQVLPVSHPLLAQSYNNVGSTYGDLGDHKKSLEYQLKALAIREHVLPADHPDLATSYNNVGSAYGVLGDYEKALEYQLKALTILEQVLPTDHPSLATGYNNVGSTYVDLGDHKKALEFQLKALEIQERGLPMDHPYNVMCCSNIAVTYARIDDFANAVSYIRRAVESGEHSMPGHPNLKQIKEVAEIMELLSTMHKNNVPFPFDNPFKT